MSSRLTSWDKRLAEFYGRMIESHALSGKWSAMANVERQWVGFSSQFHGDSRTQLSQIESDARHSLRKGMGL